MHPIDAAADGNAQARHLCDADLINLIQAPAYQGLDLMRWLPGTTKRHRLALPCNAVCALRGELMGKELSVDMRMDENAASRVIFLVYIHRYLKDIIPSKPRAQVSMFVPMLIPVLCSDEHPQELHQGHDRHCLSIRHACDGNVFVMLQSVAHPRAKGCVLKLAVAIDIGHHCPNSFQRYFLIFFADVAFPLRFENTECKPSRRARLGIRTLCFGLVQQCAPQT